MQRADKVGCREVIKSVDGLRAYGSNEGEAKVDLQVRAKPGTWRTAALDIMAAGQQIVQARQAVSDRRRKFERWFQEDQGCVFLAHRTWHKLL